MHHYPTTARVATTRVHPGDARILFNELLQKRCRLAVREVGHHTKMRHLILGRIARHVVLEHGNDSALQGS